MTSGMIINFLVGLQSLVVEMLLLMGMGKNVFWVGRFCVLTIDQALLTCVDRFCNCIYSIICQAYALVGVNCKFVTQLCTELFELDHNLWFPVYHFLSQ